MLRGKERFTQSMAEHVTIISRDRNFNVIKNSQSNQFTVTLSIMLWVTVPLHEQQRSN